MWFRRCNEIWQLDTQVDSECHRFLKIINMCYISEERNLEMFKIAEVTFMVT